MESRRVFFVAQLIKGSSSEPSTDFGFNKSSFSRVLPWAMVHPPKQTWNLKMDPWKRRFLLETTISRFHVNFWGCRCYGRYLVVKVLMHQQSGQGSPWDPSSGFTMKVLLDFSKTWGCLKNGWSLWFFVLYLLNSITNGLESLWPILNSELLR